MAHILYASKPTIPIADSVLNNILTVSRKRNQAEDITGMLLFDNESFLQLLEGDRDSIHRVYDGITQDARHQNLKILLEDDLSDRLFPDWSMGYAGSYGIQDFKIVDQQLQGGKRRGRHELRYRLLSLFRRAITLPVKLRTPVVDMRQGFLARPTRSGR